MQQFCKRGRYRIFHNEGRGLFGWHGHFIPGQKKSYYKVTQEKVHIKMGFNHLPTIYSTEGHVLTHRIDVNHITWFLCYIITEEFHEKSSS